MSDLGIDHERLWSQFVFTAAHMNKENVACVAKADLVWLRVNVCHWHHPGKRMDCILNLWYSRALTTLR